jgi:hypothetical protein
MLDGDEYVRETFTKTELKYVKSANQILLNLISGRILSRSNAVGGRNTFCQGVCFIFV